MRCHDCQLMQANTHPDWHCLLPDPGKKTLGIDPIRVLIDTLFQRSRQGGAKIVYIPDATQLTEAAANALLKILEEPPEDVWYFLSCHEPSRLLMTLRSRCFAWDLLPPDEEQGLNWLQERCKVSREESITAFRLSGGAPLAAEALLAPSSWQKRDLLCKALRQVLETDLLSLLPMLDQDGVSQTLDWLCALLLDALKWKQLPEQGAIANVDQQPLVVFLAKHFSTSVLDRSLSEWIRCRDRLVNIMSVNRELLLTQQLLAWEMLLSSHSVVIHPK